MLVSSTARIGSVGLQLCGDVVGDKRRLSGQALVQHAAQRKHIRGWGQVATPAGLLWRHVLRRADDHPGLGHCLRGGDAAGDAEVEDLCPADVSIDEEQVRWLQISVK